MVLPIVLATVFITLGILHFYWAGGGVFGFSQSLPTNERGERILHPRKIESALVGTGLILFGIYYLMRSGLFKCDLPVWTLTYVGWIIPSIFLLRSIGDFKYIGFFKKVRNTKFAKLDSKFFSPLCLLIALIGIAIQMNK